MKIFLDDKRDPPDGSWHLARTYDDFVKALLSGAPITAISFDHDLGLIPNSRVEAPSGMDAAKFMIDEAMDDPSILSSLGSLTVHSSNPPGAKNIESYLLSAQKAGIINQHVSIKII